MEFFDTILDIGGSSPNIETGALIELGYLHRPKKLIIFDLLPDEQYWGAPKYNQQKIIFFHGDPLNTYTDMPKILV